MTLASAPSVFSARLASALPWHVNLPLAVRDSHDCREQACLSCVYVCTCLCLCVWQHHRSSTRSDRRCTEKAKGGREETAFSAPLLMTFALSNTTEQGLLQKATYSTAGSAARNVDDPNLNHAHNWITYYT